MYQEKITTLISALDEVDKCVDNELIDYLSGEIENSLEFLLSDIEYWRGLLIEYISRQKEEQDI